MNQTEFLLNESFKTLPYQYAQPFTENVIDTACRTIPAYDIVAQAAIAARVHNSTTRIGIAASPRVTSDAVYARLLAELGRNNQYLSISHECNSN